ncbi:uncharacterized protein LOC115452800 [Manduca sexta]|uniref:uncharacterized protein LOC115452800 n=1 Tax=Manduca sexta TaxID=7130 RepID=UPI00188FA3FD|nr:uncharacterized protein LOC115452800 [Manduca sexta]
MAPSRVSNSGPLTESDIFRNYYTDNDYFLSPEGILKVVSALICVAASVVFISGGSCDAPGLLAGTTSILLVCGAALCFLYAGVALDIPRFAPQAWLYTDIVTSTVTGVLMLVISVLGMMLCGMTTLVNTLFSPLVLLNAVLVTGSGVVTYVRVMHRWDAERIAHQPQSSAPIEHEV